MEMHSVDSTESLGKKNPKVKCYPQWNWTRASDFHALHVTVWAISPFAGSLRPLDPYVVMLYSFLDLENFWNQ